MKKSKSVLFVCLGNICRSPAAEGILQTLLVDAGLDQRVKVDSAGTSAYHTGEKADPRMREHALKRGYKLLSLARQFDARNDFEEFDYIITMDQSNYRNVLSLDRGNRYQHKVIPMVSFCTEHNVTHVPDPYLRDEDGFELVLDILEDGCRGILKKLQEELG